MVKWERGKVFSWAAVRFRREGADRTVAGV